MLPTFATSLMDRLRASQAGTIKPTAPNASSLNAVQTVAARTFGAAPTPLESVAVERPAPVFQTTAYAPAKAAVADAMYTKEGGAFQSLALDSFFAPVKSPALVASGTPVTVSRVSDAPAPIALLAPSVTRDAAAREARLAATRAATTAKSGKGGGDWGVLALVALGVYALMKSGGAKSWS